MAMPFRALESTSLMPPKPRAEMSVLFAEEAFKGAGVSSLMGPNAGDWVLSRTGTSFVPLMVTVIV